MSMDAYDFDLPEDLIALRPLKPRPASRMLVTQGGGIKDAHVHDLPRFLRAGDLLVFNDTRVIPARLFGELHRETVARSGSPKDLRGQGGHKG